MMRKILNAGIVVMFVLVGFAVMIDLTSENVQGTDVSGTIGVNTTWDIFGSPYIVVSGVRVASGITLKIDPGVVVKFDGYYSINVEGTLNATGTSLNRITITSNMAVPDISDWNEIRVNTTGHVEIHYTDISYGRYGVFLWQSSNNNITYSNIAYNTQGIRTYLSSGNMIMNNTIANNRNGVYLYLSSNNTVENNTFTNNGVYLRGSQLSHYNTHRMPDNNFINGNPLYYFKDCTGLSIDGIPIGEIILANCRLINMNNLVISNTDVGIEIAYSNNLMLANSNISFNLEEGIYIEESSNISLSGNDFYSNDDDGISIDSSNNVNVSDNEILYNGDDGLFTYSTNNLTITNNNASHNDWNGIYLEDSPNSLIGNNTVFSNTGDGIYLYSSSSSNITENDVISNSQYGIELWSSTSVKVFHNNIISNSIQAYDNMDVNIWNDTYPSGGNYWSNWSPTCIDNFDGAITPQTGGSPDGICDNQYDIDADNSDFYPLTSPWTPPITPSDTTAPTITDLQPPDGSRINDDTPLIGANFSDPSGIDVSSVTIMVDGVDMTSSATITSSGVSYTPGTALSAGQHQVAIEVRDSVGNLATKSWSFNVEAAPPEQPAFDYWWIIILIIIIVIILIILFLIFRRRKKPEEEGEQVQSESSEVSPGSPPET